MKKNILAIDFGNTLIKTGVFSNDELILLSEFEKLSNSDIKKIISAYDIQSAILSSVTPKSKTLEAALKKIIHVTILSSSTPVPIINKYAEKKSLGADRLAAAVAAKYFFMNKNVLVVQCGTCITIDVLNSKGEYLGGSISPGLSMRLKALHTFTGKLPLIKKSSTNKLIGSTTAQSILSGVMLGTSREIDSAINTYKKQFPNLKVIVSGGDSPLLVPQLKNKIFAVPNIVLNGLYQIQKFNARSSY